MKVFLSFSARKLVPILLFILLWQSVVILVESYRQVSFPSPLDTAAALWQLMSGRQLSEHVLFEHIIASLRRWFAGFIIAAVSGVLYGLFAGWSKRFEEATYMSVHILQLIPGLAWIPVAILCFGVSEAATVFMIAMTAFPPIAINVLDGVKHLDTTFVRAARMVGAGGSTLLFQVLLPGALPSIISGLRIGLGNGWRVLVAAEMVVGTGMGLGYSIIQSRWTLDYPAAFACLAIICLIGLAVEHAVFQPLEKLTVTRWRLKGQTS